MQTRLFRTALAIVLASSLASQALAYVYSASSSVWLPGSIPFQIKLGTGTGPLQDGTNFTTSLQAALDLWNTNVGVVQFAGTAVTESSTTDANHTVNEIVFSDTVDGEAFGTGVLAVTLTYSRPSIHQIAQTDIFFNTFYTWNSYRGVLQSDKDIRRVALHELGHVLGLGHPDESGQSASIPALMSSHVSNLDTLAADDISGAQSIYRAPGDTSVPGNNNFANASSITLSNNAATAVGTTYYTTKEAGEPNHAGSTGGRSAWWKWTAAAGGSITITTNGSKFDTLLGIYTGASVSALTTIASNDEASGSASYSTVTFNAVGGTTYYVAVDGWQAQSGSVTLGFIFTPAVTTVPAAITSQPVIQVVPVGQTALFNVSASGQPSPNFRWQRLAILGGGWTDLSDVAPYSGTGTPNLSIANPTVGMSGDQFRCVVSNSAGSDTSQAATLTVNVVIAPPVITTEPQGQTVAVGANVVLTVVATGADPLTYQWKRNNLALVNSGTYSGATTTALTITNAQQSDSANYTATVTNPGGSTTSAAATVVIQVIPPAITTPPQNLVRTIGGSATFTVTATGTPTLSYQWKKSGVNLLNSATVSGATTATLTVAPIQTSHGGIYSVTVTNAAGSITSNYAALFLQPIAGAVGGSDLNGDNKADLFWQNTSNGDSYAWLMNGTALASSLYLGNNGTDWRMVGTGDFNGDGKGDLMWRNSHTYDCYVWLMNGASLVSSAYLGNNGAQWEIRGTGDFNNDAKADIIWQNNVTGDVYLWLMNGTSLISSVFVGTNGPQWLVVGSGDFNADGKSDLVWQNSTTGAGYLWLMNGTALGSSVPSTNRGNIWQITGASDYNGDGFTDLIWSNTITGERQIGLMNAINPLTTISLGVTNLQWALGRSVLTLRPAPSDFNGDGKSDLIWQNATEGYCYIWMMNGTSVLSSYYLGSNGTAWEIATSGDFNSDGRTDLVWQNPLNGDRYIWLMDGTSLISAVFIGSADPNWNIVASGDFNGDGQSDLVWQNNQTGDRYIWLMSGTSVSSSVFLGNTAPAWNIVGAGDFNGDGKPDLIWQNMYDGDSYVWLMNGTTLLSSVFLGSSGQPWRLAGSGDFNSDGSADLIWQHIFTGDRYIWLMNGTTVSSSVFIGNVAPVWRVMN
ncbi:MAG: FG-GAP-like repeat-containing protein [Opitutus sp.]